MDKVLVHHGLTTLDVIAAGLLGIMIFESALSGLRSYVFAHTASRIDVELGSRLFRHLVSLPLAYFQARRVGDSVARVRELENIRSFLTGNAITLVLDVLFSVVFIAVMFMYSGWLTLVVVLSLPLYFLISLFVTPLLQTMWPNLPGFNMLSAGLVIGIMIVPYISSMSEDAMRAVPMHIREGSYAMGATRFQTAFRAVIPSALSGIAAAYVLGISRAIGETMVVAIAAGMQPTLTWNPTEPAETMTAYIVQVSMGDLPHGSIGYQTIFVAGLMLFLMTLVFNVGGHILKRRLRQAI